MSELTARYRWACATILIVGTVVLTSCRPRESPVAPPDRSASSSDSTATTEKPSPPDLSGCTRVELRFIPPVVSWLPGPYMGWDVLSEEEIKYLQTIQVVVLNDRDRIDAIAFDVSQGQYDERTDGASHRADTIEVTGYRNGKPLASFFARYDDYVQTSLQRGHVFRYPQGLSSIFRRPLPGVAPFEMRVDCGENLRFLSDLIHQYLQQKNAYPPADAWCDILAGLRLKAYLTEEKTRARFICPSAGRGICHYALNPECKPDSPADTVLLFETKAGWNQHGGPELFVLNNHEPVGGCVLLNDDEPNDLKWPTLRFIRTPREAQQLRWR